MKNRPSKILVLTMIFFISLLSCKQQDSKNKASNALKQNALDSILQQPIQFPNNAILLSEEASNEVESWILYEAMKGEIDRMENYTLDDAIANSPNILRATDTLLKTIPTKFKTKPIEARIKVLHTKASVLHQLSQKQQKDFNKIKEVAEEMPIDFLNLNIQLNEVFIELPNFENKNK